MPAPIQRPALGGEERPERAARRDGGEGEAGREQRDRGFGGRADFDPAQAEGGARGEPVGAQGERRDKDK